MFEDKPRAVFLDRDGTINQEVGYIRRPDQVRLIPGSGRAVARLNRAGFKVVVVSNQSGLARGYFGLEAMWAVQAEVERQLAGAGARLDGFYFCPHLPDGQVEAYTMTCACRKPRPGMVLTAAREMGLALAGSFMVGDRLGDVTCGNAAGLTSILVATGHDDGDPGEPGQRPAFKAPDLAAAVDWILDRKVDAGRI